MVRKLKFFRGKKGGVISRLPSGKVVLPVRGFNPSPGEEWVVEIAEKERYAIAKPVAKIVKREVRIYEKYKCGHTKLVGTELREMPENEIKDEEFIEIPEYCRKCRERLVNADLKDLDNINDIEAAVKAKNRKLEDRIHELESKKYELQQSVYITENRGTSEFECRHCGSKVPLKEGQLTCPQCGAGYVAKVVVDIEEGFWEKTWIHEFWSVRDLQREKEVQKQVEKIDIEISELSEKIKENFKFLEQKYREELKRLGIREVEYDVDGSGYG